MKNKEHSDEYYMLRELIVSEIVHATHLRDCKNIEDILAEGDRYTKVLKNIFGSFFERIEGGE